MPVTFRPAPWHKAEALDAKTARVMSAQELLWMSCGDDARICDEMLQSSFGRGAGAQSSDRLSPAPKGLVTTISDAYEKHRALVLRPDDVWLAILCQFYRYVNAHAEELRSKFVAHQGKIDLTVVRDPGTRHTLPFDDMARDMTREMNKHIVDPTVRTWILPGFSTTTPNDTVVAAVTMMATMKAYFRYVLRGGCGLPQVTLEGNKADWEAILLRAAKLKEYGEEPTRWYGMLAPVLTRFVRAFDDPHGADNLDFWQKVLHSEGTGMSCAKWLSGWITAFCVFGKDGRWTGPSASEPPTPGTMDEVKDEMREVYPSKPKIALELDGVLYPVIGEGVVPGGYAEVDVELDDNGVKFDAKMMSGLVASRVSDSQDLSLSLAGKGDTISPFPGWWIFTARKQTRPGW